MKIHGINTGKIAIDDIAFYIKNIEQEKNNIVKKLLDKNMSIEEIIEITNLTKEEVEKISKN